MAAIWFAGYCPLYAENTPVPSSKGLIKSEKDPYVITADMLMVDNDNHFAEFSGNVKVVQGSMVITARRIQLFFRDDQTKENTLKADESSIKEIIARDTVTIKLDNRIALTHQAVYNTDTKVLILSGENSQIIMDENTITGTQITFYRTEGRIAVEGGSSERVKAIFYNGEKKIE